MTTTLPPFPFAVLDTETTGLTPRSDKIIELAIQRFEGGEKVAEYESLFQAGQSIPPHVQVLTRIKPSDLEGKPEFAAGAQKFASLLEGVVLVGHNIPFDMGMLKGEGIDLEGKPWIDSAMLASLVFPEELSWSLGYISTTLDLPHEPKHRAMGDVHATVALFEKIWERLSELPKDLGIQIKEIAEKGSEGYATLFSAIEAKGSGRPEWLEYKKRNRQSTSPNHQLITNQQAPKEGDGKVWMAVKNLEATVRSCSDEDLKKLNVIHAPQFLLDPKSKEKFLKQDSFTSYEFTLALKLIFFDPKIQSGLPIHSEERDVWKGKLACTKDSEIYKEQFKEEKKQTLIDHRQLLELLTRGEGPKDGDSIVIDDASMLEDTATKAFRWSCSIDPLRAAAEGNADLTSFLDAYQIWVEKVRNFQDIRYLVTADLKSSKAMGLKTRLEEILSGDLTDQVREKLEDLSEILNPDNLDGRIVWIAQFRDGGQILQSVPMDIASVLDEMLYEKFPTTLLLPAGEKESFAAVLPDASNVKIEQASIEQASLRYAEPEMTFDRLLPCIDGKVIALVTSKRMIEQIFVKYTEVLEEQGIMLIAQGLSGGLGRMQAEFLAAEGRVVWLITPWMYEGVELPPETVDHLWIHTLPFDHPSHAVLSIRSDRYRDSFGEYFVPRLLHRLFRLLRKYAEHHKKDGDILVFDQRLKTKGYGKRVMEYLSMLTS
jgi:DNA polymerase III epsilon subunit-like protein